MVTPHRGTTGGPGPRCLDKTPRRNPSPYCGSLSMCVGGCRALGGSEGTGCRAGAAFLPSFNATVVALEYIFFYVLYFFSFLLDRCSGTEACGC